MAKGTKQTLLVMDLKKKKKEEALEIINALDIPLNDLTARRTEKMALALLAASNIKPDSSWDHAKCWEGRGSWALTTREMINFWNVNYGESVSMGSYDDVRRKDLRRLVQSGVVVASAANPDASPNDPTRRYAVSQTAGAVLRSYGTPKWRDNIKQFLNSEGSYKDRLERVRHIKKIPVILAEKKIELSVGEHSELTKAIIEEFLPRYAHNVEILYVGDTHQKIVYLDEKKLRDLGIPVIAAEVLPDVIAFVREKNWLFLIEAVHSANPISKERHLSLEELSQESPSHKIYVSVFKDRASLKTWLSEISWESEVWLAESPDHMIHFDGEKFLGPTG